MTPWRLQDAEVTLQRGIAGTIARILCAIVSMGGARPCEGEPATTLLNYNRQVRQLLPGKVDQRQISLKVEKSRFLLTVFYRGRALKSYPVVLGADPIHDKVREGDGCTPEGRLAIAQIRSPHRWTAFMLLNYPTAAARRRFQEARREGRLPANAQIGGAVGIHGVPKGHDEAIDAHQNWTAGCISLKTADIQELASLCRRGTTVTIVH